jgi:hypothetical protein
MRITAPVVLVAIGLASPISQAHQINPDEYDAKPIISDVNAIASSMFKDKLSNFDIVVIAGAACTTFRVAVREQFVERIGAELNKRYPTADEVKAVTLDEFIEFERTALSKLGANEQAIKLIEKAIRDHPNLPTSSPAKIEVLAARVTTLENRSCDLRAQPAVLAAPTATAKDDDAKWAKCLGMSVIGFGAMAGNFAIGTALAPKTGPVGLFVIGSISGGWGWNRVEAACF